jgi:hypothetical protein
MIIKIDTLFFVILSFQEKRIKKQTYSNSKTDNIKLLMKIDSNIERILLGKMRFTK